MSPVRARKEAARRLAIALQIEHRALLEATTPEDIQAAALKLGQTFNDNLAFTINVLRDWGGMEAKFEVLPKPALPKMPASLVN